MHRDCLGIRRNAWGLRGYNYNPFIGIDKNPNFVWGPSPRIRTQYYCMGMGGVGTIFSAYKVLCKFKTKGKVQKI